MSILVVDDSRVMLAMLTAILQSVGFCDVIAVDSIGTAFDHLGLRPSTDAGAADLAAEVDLILMDLIMPEMDGVDAIRRIKAAPALQDIPIIAVTARDETEDLRIAFEAGAVDYITKPVNEVILLARVRSALRFKQEMDRRKAREQELLRLTLQLEETNGLLRQLSSIDELTGLANRRIFDAAVETEWDRARRTQGWLALLMVDIDHFKCYNDDFGHQQGDACLRRVAETLTRSVHRAGDLVARYGGEEFAVLLAGADAAGALTVAERLRAAVEALGIEAPAAVEPRRVTISIGVAALEPRWSDRPSELMSAADAALYRAKRSGRNQVATAGDSQLALAAKP